MAVTLKEKIASKLSYNFRFPLTVALIVEVLSSIQILHIIFKSSLNPDDDLPGLLNFLIRATVYSGTLRPWNFSNLDDNMSRLCWYSIIIYFMVHLTIFMIVIASETVLKHQIRKTLLQMVSVAHLLHSRIIFFGIQSFLFALINFYNDCKPNIDSAYCCSTSVFGISIVLCLLNTCLAFLKELFFYHINKNKNAYAVKNNSYHQIILAHKMLLLILFHFLANTSDIKTQICSIVSVLLTLLCLGIIFFKLPFYSIKMLKASTVVTTITSSTSFIVFLSTIGVQNSILDIALLVLVTFAVMISLNSLNRVSDNVMKGRFNSPEKAILFISLLKQSKFGYLSPLMFENKLSIGAFLSVGSLKIREYDITSLKEVKSTKRFQNSVYVYLLEVLSGIAEHSPSPELAFIYMTEIYIRKLGNIPSALECLKKINSLKLSLHEKNSVRDLKEQLKEAYKREYFVKTGEQLDFINYFSNRECLKLFKEKIMHEIANHLEFWEEMKKNAIDIRKVVSIAYDIDTTSRQIEQIYKAGSASFTEQFGSSLILYGAYLWLVQEYVNRAKSLLHIFTHISQRTSKQHKFNIYSEDIAIVIISINRFNLGTINDASVSVESMFMTDRSRLIGSNISSLLPYITSINLISIIRNYVMASTQNLDEKIIGYAKTAHGDIFEVEIRVQLHPRLEEDVQFMVVFEKKSAPKSIIMINSDDMIKECSNSIKRVLNIKPKDEKGLRLQDICIDYKQMINTLAAVNAMPKPIENTENSPQKASGSTPKVRASHIWNDTFKNMLENPKKTPFLTLSVTNIAFPSTTGISLSKEKTKETYHDFTEEGRFRFIPLFTTPSSRYEVSYKVQVVPYDLSGEVYKVLILTNDQDNKDTSDTSTSAVDHKVQKLYFDPRTELNIENITKESQKALNHEGDNKPTLYVTTKTTKHSNKKEKSKKTKTIYKNAMNLFGVDVPKNQKSATSGSSASSKAERNLKRLRFLFDHKGSYPSLKKIIRIIYLIVACLTTIGLVSFFISLQSMQQAETDLNIVDDANVRLSSAMKAYQATTRFFLRYAKLRTGQIQTLKDSVYEQVMMLLQTNKNFLQNITSDIQAVLIDNLYEKNIELWENYENKIFTNKNVDTFVASNQLAYKMLRISNASNIESPEIIEEARYVVNNTANDYLVSSEDIIEHTHNLLEDHLHMNSTILRIILTAEMSTLFALCLCLVYAGNKVVQAYKKLFRAIVQAEDDKIDQRLQKILKLSYIMKQDIEVKEFALNAFKLLEPSRDFKKEAATLNLSRQKRTKKFFFRGVLLYLIKFSLPSLLVIIMIACLFGLLLLESVINFDFLEKARNQISLTSRGKYQLSVVLGSFYMDMVFRNTSEILVRNDLPSVQMPKTYHELVQIHQSLAAGFSEDGLKISDPLVNQIFYNDVCSFVPTATKAYCQTATQGKKEGFFSTSERFLLTFEFYMNLFLSDPTYASAKRIIDPYAVVIRPCVETIEAGYQFLLSHVMQNVHEKYTSFKGQQTALYAALLLMSIVCVVVIQFVTLRYFGKLYQHTGKILKVLPTTILLENKAIRFYLNKTFLNNTELLMEVI